MILESLFNPATVLLIGASADENKWGNWLAEQLSQHRDTRKIYFVGTKAQDLYGIDCVTAFEKITDSIDLAVVAVSTDILESVVDQLLDLDIKNICIITAGLAEAGFIDIESKIVEKIKDAGIRLIGPNCAGLWDSHSRLYCMPLGNFIPGPVGIISQSGGVIADVADRLKEKGIGISRAISIGNNSISSIEHLVKSLEEDPNTEIIAVYIEDEPVIPYDLLNTCSKPVALLCPLSSPTTAVAAAKHTNSKVRYVFNCTYSIRDFVDKIEIGLSRQRAFDRRVQIVTDSGGMGVLTASACEYKGLLINPLTPILDTKLRETLDGHKLVSFGNPLDLVNVPNGFTDSLEAVVKTLQSSRDIDAIIVVLSILGSLEQDSYDIGQQIAQHIRQGKKPTVFVTQCLTSLGIKALLDNKITVVKDIESAVNQLDMICSAR